MLPDELGDSEDAPPQQDTDMAGPVDEAHPLLLSKLEVEIEEGESGPTLATYLPGRASRRTLSDVDRGFWHFQVGSSPDVHMAPQKRPTNWAAPLPRRFREMSTNCMGARAHPSCSSDVPISAPTRDTNNDRNRTPKEHVQLRQVPNCLSMEHRSVPTEDRRPADLSTES